MTSLLTSPLSSDVRLLLVNGRRLQHYHMRERIETTIDEIDTIFIVPPLGTTIFTKIWYHLIKKQ